MTAGTSAGQLVVSDSVFDLTDWVGYHYCLLSSAHGRTPDVYVCTPVIWRISGHTPDVRVYTPVARLCPSCKLTNLI